MNKKDSTFYVCNNCGQEFTKWLGRCTACGSWDTICEMRGVSAKSEYGILPKNPSNVVEFSNCNKNRLTRISANFSELDRVLGGGLVPGGVILLGGEPGIGKSTLLLQILALWAKQGKKTLYVSGEESIEQIYMRAERLNVSDSPIKLLSETCMETVIEKLTEIKPEIFVIDSIQTMFLEKLESAPGSVPQVRDCTSVLLRFAKQNSCSAILVGHVTKEGAIAGPRVLEHMVDTVLYFEGDSHYFYRIIRAVKNRYGPSGEIAIFSMSDKGLCEVKNPSEFFLDSLTSPQIGTSVVPIMEGSRVLVVEVQSLVNRSCFGLPQRVASGVNPKKLSLILAVLEKFSGLSFGEYDIFFNVAGGLSVSEPAIDLAMSASIISSLRNKAIPKDTAFIGEIGLGGEIRQVSNISLRLKELSRMGFSKCIIPPISRKSQTIDTFKNISLIKCEKISQINDLLF